MFPLTKVPKLRSESTEQIIEKIFMKKIVLYYIKYQLTLTKFWFLAVFDLLNNGFYLKIKSGLFW